MSLLILAAVFWKVKQRYDHFRRIQRMAVERQQWANRPFATHRLLFDVKPPEPKNTFKPPTSARTRVPRCTPDDDVTCVQAVTLDDVNVDVLKQRVESNSCVAPIVKKPATTVTVTDKLKRSETAEKLQQSRQNLIDSPPTSPLQSTAKVSQLRNEKLTFIYCTVLLMLSCFFAVRNVAVRFQLITIHIVSTAAARWRSRLCCNWTNEWRASSVC